MTDKPKAELEAKFNGGEIYQSYLPFDQAVVALKNSGLKPACLRDVAWARTQLGKDSPVSVGGSYVAEGFAQKRDYATLALSRSCLLEKKYLLPAIQANQKGRYFATDNDTVYKALVTQAKQEAKKEIELEKRSVLILPTQGSFEISRQTDAARFFLGNQKQVDAYFDFIGRNNLHIVPANTEHALHQKGTVLTQVWVAGLGSGSYFTSGGVRLGDGGRVRGFKKIPKTKRKRVVRASPEELDNVADVLGEGMHGIIGIGNREEAMRTLERLRGGK